MPRILRLCSLAVLLFACAPALHAQSISTGLSVSGAPALAVAGQPVTLTATLSVSSGPVSATNGLPITFSFSGNSVTASLQNGVATVSINAFCSDLHGCGTSVYVDFPLTGNFGPSSAYTSFLVVQPAYLNGSFAFTFRGRSASNGEADDTFAIGSLELFDGYVTGEEDLNTPSGSFQKVPVTGSYVSGTDDGSLNLTLHSAQGTQNFTVFLPYTSVSNAGHPANATNLSFVSAPGSQVTGSGILTAQVPPGTQGFAGSSLVGAFLLNASGQTACSNCQGHESGPVALSGQLFVGTSGSGASVLASETIGSNVYPATSVAATPTAPDASGRFTFTLAASGAPFADQPTHYAAYEIDAAHLYLMSLDPHSKFILLSGTAVAEP